MEINQFDALLPPQMAERAAEAGVGKATKDPMKSFLLAITAGLHIGIAFIFYTTITTGIIGNWVMNFFTFLFFSHRREPFHLSHVFLVRL